MGRQRLLAGLSAGSGFRLTLVACPAGYGKTSLLADWHQAESRRRAMAWVSLDEGDNDPTVFWSYLLRALSEVCPEVGAVAPAPASPILDLLLPRLVNVLAQQPPVVLILDDFHVLTNLRLRETIAWLVEHAPLNFQLVVATRKEPDLALASLRAHGDLMELRVEDLRLTVEEADQFLNDRQMLGIEAADVELLVERMDGWPAGLYLAALSLRRAKDRHALVSRFGASNRHVMDFLESEIVEAHDPGDQEMMLRCSILSRLSGPLCDAVLERHGTAQDLLRLSRSNLFLAPLDEEGDWYRFHPLFAQMLRVELERREPGAALLLHIRAFHWHRNNGEIGEAIAHAMQAGKGTEAADLVAENWYSFLNAGRYDTVLAWLRELGDGLVRGDVRLLLAQAWVHSMSGNQSEAAASVAAAEPLVASHAQPLADGLSSAEASLTLLRGVFPWGNVGEAQRHARRAFELEGPDSPWHAVACWAVAMAHFWRGEYAEADAMLAEATALAPASGHWLIKCASLSYRSLVAGEAGRVEVQVQLAEDAMVLAREHGLQSSTAGPPLAHGASLLAQGRSAEALPALEQAVALARFQAQPLLLVRTLRYLSEALSLLGDEQRAAAVTHEARTILAACVDPAGVGRQAPGPRRERGAQGTTIVEPLTQRELTVLTLLSGHRSEADIGRELFVSRSTVHSHVKSIYRKLGATSRQEALDHAHEGGFL